MCGNVGMWFERFEIIITSLTRDFLPSSWHCYWPTWVDLCTLAGSFGLFLTLFLLVLPVSADGGDGGSEDGDAPGACSTIPMRCSRRRGGRITGPTNIMIPITMPRGLAIAVRRRMTTQHLTRSQNYPSAETSTPKTHRGRCWSACRGIRRRRFRSCAAAQKVRTAGYKVWDVHSPFPIHGIDAVIGIRPTILPWIVLGGGSDRAWAVACSCSGGATPTTINT